MPECSQTYVLLIIQWEYKDISLITQIIVMSINYQNPSALGLGLNVSQKSSLGLSPPAAGLSGRWFARAPLCARPTASDSAHPSAPGAGERRSSPGTFSRPRGTKVAPNPAHAYWSKLKDLIWSTETDNAKKQAVVGTHFWKSSFRVVSYNSKKIQICRGTVV